MSLVSSASTVTLNKCITLSGTYATVQVTASDGSSVPFTATSSDTASTYFTVSQSDTKTQSDTTKAPATVTIQLVRAPGSSQALGTVTLASTGAASATIAVNYDSTVDCTPVTSGNGYVSVSPVSLSLGTASVVSSTLTLTNSTAAAITFTTAQSSWLSVSPSTGTVSASGSVNLVVTASSATLAVSTYSGSVVVTPSQGNALTVPVTFVVGTGSSNSGTLTLNSTGATTYNMAFNYSSGGTIPNSQLVSVQSSTGAYSFATSLNPDSSWLAAGQANQVNQGLAGWPVVGGVYVGLSQPVTTLAAGTYTGVVTLTAIDGGVATINVTLTVNNSTSTGVTISPSTAYTFNAAVGSTTTQSATFTAATDSSTLLTYSGITASSTTGWLSIATSGNNNAATIVATVNPAGLSGTYTGIITIPSFNSSSGAMVAGSTTISITLVVGTGTSTTSSTVAAPTSMSFAYQAGYQKGPSDGLSQTLAVAGTVGATFTIASDRDWIFVQGYANAAVQWTMPAYLTVFVYPTYLTTGTTPTGHITITAPDGTITVPVSFEITSLPVLVPTPLADVVLTAAGSQTITFLGSDGATPSLTVGTPSATWITATKSGSNVTIATDPGSLATGKMYSGTVTVADANYPANSPVTVPVVLVVGMGSGALTLSPSSFSFTGVANGSAPASQILYVTATSATAFTASASLGSCTSTNWLSINPASGTTPQNISVTVTQTGLTAGTTCSGSISLVSSGLTQNVAVTLTVTSTAVTGGDVTASPTSLSFTSTAGGSAPGTQTIRVANKTSGTATIPYTVTASTTNGVGSWLSVSPTSASTQSSVTVSVTPGSNPAGTYSGTVTITPTGGSAVSVPVTLTVQPAASISVAPTALSFSYQLGGSTPSAGTLQVTGNTAGLTFTAAASSTGNWLTVSPASGTAGTTATALSVGVDSTALSSLATGTYTGTVSITSTNGATSPGAVTVTLTVSAPLPTITSVVSGASFLTGAVSPGEVVTLFASDSAHPIGPATAVQTTLDSAGKVSTSIGGVQVLFNGYAAPLLYAGAGQINAVVPYEVSGLSSLSVWVKFLGQTSNAAPLTLAATAPAIFNSNGSGAIQNAAWVTSSNPAAKDSVFTMYLTGEGQTSPAGVTGKVTTVASSAPLTPQPLLVPGVTIDGQPASVEFYGEAPGFVSGILQMNVRIPAAAASGNLPIVVKFLNGASTPSGVTVSVK